MDQTTLLKCCDCKLLKEDSQFGMLKSTRVVRKSKRCKECSKVISNKRRSIAKLQKEHGKGQDYVSRNKWVQHLGFIDYRDYLHSDLWKSIRDNIFMIKGNKCYLCQDHATELHHNRYYLNDLNGKKIKYINPICRICHEKIEFIDGQKATLKQAKNLFKKNRKQRKSKRWK